MKIDWPDNPTELEGVKYLKALHSCVEDNSAKLGRKITITSISAFVAVIIAMSTATLTMARWFAAVDASLKTMGQIVDDQKAQSAKMDAFNTKIEVLMATSQDNNTALLGPNSASNRRAALRNHQ